MRSFRISSPFVCHKNMVLRKERNMKNWIRGTIENYIHGYERNTVTKWGKPIVGFADAGAAAELAPQIVAGHGLPSDAVSDAKIIIAYFVPFLKGMADTNKAPGPASPEWAQSYEETNAMLAAVNEHLVKELRKKGYDAAVHPAAASFDRENLISSWSHRHMAYLAGLGTFGLNNMLITEKGCCGRYSTIVTNLDVAADAPMEEEMCGYKRDGSCGACMMKCPSGALKADGFDRHKCYEICKQNAAAYTSFGNSYGEEDGKAVGSEVCGKCVAGMPCAFL